MMTKCWFGRFCQWKVGAYIALLGALSAGVSDSVLAQIVPDKTQGAERSIVKPNVKIKGIPSDQIEGGATRGANLFHSFQDFNVKQGRGAYFANPTAIENILTRVTGSNASKILGRLGVLGDANLFLLNPNGIVFGKDASLDIQGSFTATTAEQIQLGDDGYFSAVEPPKSRLLSVSPGALFFSQVANQPTAIINQGNLSTGKDLSLSASNLNLQGQLVSGGDLTLQAQDTVKVRDSATMPFIASAKGKLLAQGNHRVDIFALNHPRSGLFSGGDMVLRSTNTVEGDAYYWSGGSFRVEQLDGSLGNLSSPHDPIFRARGDVFINTYQGASLHILAGGKVEIPGYVWIQGADPENGLVETVKLADGTTVAINGKKEPTLDIRAGVNPDLIGEETLSLTGSGNFIPPAYATSNQSSADIKIGTVLFANAASQPLAGRALLTNQYQPNSSLSGDIQVTQTLQNGWGAIFMDGGARKPSVVINSRGNISLDGTVNTSSSSGDGGAITLNTPNGSITTGNLDSSSNSSSGSAADGGAISLRAGGDITAKDFLSSSAGNGGAITLGAGGDISTGFLDSDSSEANGGAITVTAGENFTSSLTYSFGEGSGGAIAITAGNDIVSTSNLTSSSREGNGGEITVRAGGNFTGFGLESYSFGEGNGGPITVAAEGDITLELNTSVNSSSAAGNGGAITLDAGGNITANDFFANSGGDGGGIILTANDDISVGNLLSDSNAGNGGAVTAVSTNGKIALQSGRYGQSLIDTEGVNGGNVTLSSLNQGFVFENPSEFLSRPSGIYSGASNGNGGSIQITAPSVSLFNIDLNSSTRGRGNAGNISILTNGLAALDGSRLFTSLELGGIGRGGNITIDAGAVSLTNASFIDTATFGEGKAGDVLLQVDDSISLANDSAIFSFTAGQGDGGRVKLEAGDAVSLSNRSNISTAVNSRAQGDGGDIDITARSLSLTGGSQLVTSTSSSGKAGDITVSTIEDVFISGTDPNAIPPKNVSVGNPLSLAEVEPNDSIAQAQPLTQLFLNSPDNANPNVERSTQTPYAFVAGSRLSDDNDFYSFEVTAPGTRGIFRFDKSSNPGNVILYNGNGEQLALSSGYGPDDTGGFDSGVTRYVFSKPGTYYVNPDRSSQGNYTFLVSLETPNVATSVVNRTLPSGLFARTEGTGAGGELNIETQRLKIQDGAQVSASTSSTNPKGVGGNITVNSTQSLDLTNRARLLAESTGVAPAGNVEINTGNLTARNSTITTSSEQSSGGSITGITSEIRLFGDSDITTRVNQGTGGGGDINLKADSILAFDDNDILAYAADGKGGDIILDTPTLLAQGYRPAPANTDPRTLDNNNRVDINATGAVSGVITIPDVTFIENSLTELPENQIDTSSLLANSCIARRDQPARGSFIITGSGGLPQRPGEAQISSFSTVDVAALPNDSTSFNTSSNRPWQKGDPIVEPQGVYRLANGKLVLSQECS